MAGLIDSTPRLRYLESDYLKALLKMLPVGSIWRTVLGTLGSSPTPEERNSFVSLLSCFAAELARFENRCMYLFQEKIPGLSVEMLEDWERVAGLPDIWQGAPTNDDERRAQAQAKLIPTSKQTINDQFYIDYAASLGFVLSFDQSTSTVFRVGSSRMGDRVGGVDYSGSSINGVVNVFVAGGLNGTDYIQDVFEILKPAHIKLSWVGLSLDGIDPASITTADAFTITAIFSDGISRQSECQWSSSDESVATVDSDGFVSLVDNGTCIIQCTWYGTSFMCQLEVSLFTFVCLDDAEVSMLCIDGSDGSGGRYELKTVFDDGFEYPELCAWSSDNESIATVENGMVTAIGAGTTTVHCSFGGTTSACTFTVFATVPALSSMYSYKGGAGGGATFSFDDTSYLANIPGNLDTGFVGYERVSSSVTITPVTVRAGINSTGVGPNCLSFYHASNGYIENTSAYKSGGAYYANLGYTYLGNATRENVAMVGTGAGPTVFTYSSYCSQQLNFYPKVNTALGTSSVFNVNFQPSITRKITVVAYSDVRSVNSIYEPTVNHLSTINKWGIYMIMQKYIRKTNRTVGGVVRNNYVVVPNCGYLTGFYGISANNVPSTWFQV